MDRGQVEHRHFGPQAHGDAGGVAADDAGTEHHHVGRRYPGHAAEQHAAAALGLFQPVGADLYRHAPGHRRHGCQQGQAADGVGDRLVGQGGAAGIHQGLGLARVRGQVQVGEEGQFRAQVGEFGRLGLLHLDHQIGTPGRSRIGHDGGTGGGIGAVVVADTLAGPLFHQHLMAPGGEFADGGRHQADPVFVDLDFLGYADLHGSLLGQRAAVQCAIAAVTTA